MAKVVVEHWVSPPGLIRSPIESHADLPRPCWRITPCMAQSVSWSLWHLGLERKIIMHLYHCQYQQVFRCTSQLVLSAFYRRRWSFDCLHLPNSLKVTKCVRMASLYGLPHSFFVEHAFIWVAGTPATMTCAACASKCKCGTSCKCGSDCTCTTCKASQTEGCGNCANGKCSCGENCSCADDCKCNTCHPVKA